MIRIRPRSMRNYRNIKSTGQSDYPSSFSYTPDPGDIRLQHIDGALFQKLPKSIASVLMLSSCK